MKILIAADVLGEENNGTTIACMNLVRYLRSMGDEVRIICTDKDKIGVPNYYVVPELNLGPIINKIVAKNNVSLAKPDKNIILKALEGVDIVHVMMPFALGIKTCELAKQQGIPVTAGFHVQAENFTAHIKMMNLSFVNTLTYKHFFKKLYSKVDAIHYPTEFIRDTFEEVIGERTNSYVISNGVNDQYRKEDVIRRAPYDKYFNILTIGRYSREKSHHLLIKAVANSKYKDNIRLIFAGQGPYKKNYERLAKKYHLVTPIMKFYDRKELVNAINSSDLYVHPAEIEIEAISCLEAITCGIVPVINNSKRSATKAFALTDKNLFDCNSIKDLTNKIEYWYEHPIEKEECSNQYLGYTKQYEQNNCMKAMREMLLRNSKKEEYRFASDLHIDGELPSENNKDYLN